jgi:hypothetical protein
MIMDTLWIEPAAREPTDFIAEGLWKFASGDLSEEGWEALSDEDKAWWRAFASEAAERLMAEISSRYY